MQPKVFRGPTGRRNRGATPPHKRIRIRLDTPPDNEARQREKGTCMKREAHTGALKY